MSEAVYFHYNQQLVVFCNNEYLKHDKKGCVICPYRTENG